MKHLTSLLGSTALYFMMPEPDGGGGGGNGAGGGTGNSNGTGTGTGGGTGAEGTWKAPDGLPAEFVGKDAAETLGKILPAYTEAKTRADGFRTELATRGKPPENADGYTYKPSEKVAPFLGDMAKNPAYGAARAAAHKAGISDAAFGQFIEGIYGPLIESGELSPPFDPKTELDNYVKHNGVDRTAAATHFKEAETFAKGLAAQLKVPEALKADVEATLVVLTDTAAGNTLLRALQSRLAESGFRLPAEGEGGNNGPLTREDLKRLSSDPRIDPQNRHHTDPNKRYDEGLRKRYDEAYKALSTSNG